jgi:hypothetical protein
MPVRYESVEPPFERSCPGMMCPLLSSQPFPACIRPVEVDSGSTRYRINRDRYGNIGVLPVCVEISCSDNADVHAKSTAGLNQMYPFHYIHLPDAHFDV